MKVFVQNNQGKPLMPCTAGKARRLLRSGKACVVSECPFTLRLIYGSSGYRQGIVLGIDAGSKVVGISAVRTGNNPEELLAGEVKLRNDIVDLLSERRAARRTRRNRLRYREPRFLNRNMPEGWLAPSVRQKCESHLRIVERLVKFLPISSIRIETAQFDIQAIQRPGISGKEYQEGPQEGFWNVREYVLWRDGHHCHGKKGCTGKILNVHHIESRKTGGDSPENLITLCEDCHDAYHKGKLKLDLKRGASFRDAAFMGIMRWAVYNRLKEDYADVRMEYGFRTKMRRIAAGLPKEHRVDARCITGYPEASSSGDYLSGKLVRRNNRMLFKANPLKGGIWKRNKAPREVCGYRLFDKVQYGDRSGFVFGRRSSGSFDVRKLDGEILSAGVSFKKLRLISRGSTLLVDRIAG